MLAVRRTIGRRSHRRPGRSVCRHGRLTLMRMPTPWMVLEPVSWWIGIVAGRIRDVDANDHPERPLSKLPKAGSS